MANDINNITISGRLTRDPELRQTQNSSVVNMSLAVNEYWKGAQNDTYTSFIDVEVWGKLAENAARFLSKGKRVAVEGSIRQQTWQDDSGVKKSKVKIVGHKIIFMDSPSGNQSSNNEGQSSPPPQSNGYQQPDGYSDPGMMDDDDIPF